MLWANWRRAHSMKKNPTHYSSLDYQVQIRRLPDGVFCAEIPLIKGCKGYGETPTEALFELEGVKETLIELMLEQGKAIPEPTVQLEVPLRTFQRLKNRHKLSPFIK